MANKSFQKRIKVTRRGKLIVRRAGQNHFRAKKARRIELAKNRTARFTMKNKARGRFLH